MGVGAVVETALAAVVHHLGEVVPQLLLLDVDQAKALDARCGDQRTTLREGIHGREGGRVTTLVVALGDVARANVERGMDALYEGRFADTRVA